MDKGRAGHRKNAASQKQRHLERGSASGRNPAGVVEMSSLSGNGCIKHLRVLGFFQVLFNSIRNQARLSTARVSHLAPTSDFAMTLASKSETRALKEFLICAKYRYEMFLSLYMDNTRVPVPPWDVAIMMHAHLLAPLCLFTDLDCRKAPFGSILDCGFVFPLDQLAELIEHDTWSDPQSEQRWRQEFPESPYQLWTANPLNGGRVALQMEGAWFCPTCKAEIPFELENLLSYQLDDATISCSSCHVSLDVKGISQKDFKSHLEGFAQGRDVSQSMLFFVDRRTGKLDVEAVTQELNQIDLFNSRLWTELNRGRSVRWSVIHRAARTAAERSRRASAPTSPPPDRRRIILEDISKRYESSGATDISVNLLQTTLSMERILNNFLDDRIRSINISQWDAYCRSYRHQMLSATFSRGAQSRSIQGSSSRAKSSRSGSAYTLPLQADIFEFCWWTCLLTPQHYKSWCLKNLGDIRSYNIETSSLRQDSNSAHRRNPRTRGSNLTLPNVQRLNLERVDEKFTLAECEEALRICGESSTSFGLTTSLAAKELEFRIPESARPCAMSILKQHLEEGNEANTLRDLLLGIFSNIHKTQSVSSSIERAMTHTLAPDETLNLAFIVPESHYEYIEAFLLAEVIESEHLSGPSEQRIWNIIYETLSMKLAANAALFAPHSVQDWIEELKTHYPMTCASHISKSQEQLEEYFALAQSLVEAEDGVDSRPQEIQRQPSRQPSQRSVREPVRQPAPQPVQQIVQQTVQEPVRQPTIEETIEAGHPECALCVERRPRSLYPDRPITSSCDHERNICVPCIAKWIANQLDTKAWNQLTCSSCPSLLTSNDVEKFASAGTVDRYHRFMVKDSQKDDPLFRSCQRTNCSGGQVHLAGASEPLMICGSCGYKMCFVHERPWHEGQTCEEYDRARRGDEASERLIQQISKPCPGTNCGALIQKNEGCDHMTCARCRYEFCWECLAPYTGPQGVHTIGSPAHRAECKYRNLPDLALLNPPGFAPVNAPGQQPQPPGPPQWPQGPQYPQYPQHPQYQGYPGYPPYPGYGQYPQWPGYHGYPGPPY